MKTAESRANHIDARIDAKRARVLVEIKILHTAAWVFFAGCILAIPFAGALRYFRGAAILSGVVLFECAILAVNRGRCPFTDLAARYTGDRRENFDIYLPLWLARHNKSIFGTIFLLNELFVFSLWWLGRR
jgi:hypothetical protein